MQRFRVLRTVRSIPWLVMAALWILGPATSWAQKKGETVLRQETLTTRDGVKLNAFYYPSDVGRQAIPVMIIHDWGGQASPYAPLVAAFHEAGFAVLAPDLRGHGASDRETDASAPGGKRKLDPSQMSRREVQEILLSDLEAVKGFLKAENNDEKLNLNSLVVVGAGEGAVLAVQWSMRDWQFPSLGQIKQGQDVKSLVLVSPDKQLKGVPITPVYQDANLQQLPIMIVSGRQGPESGDVTRMAKRIEAGKRRLGRGTVTGFELAWQPTSLTAPALVGEVKSVPESIVKFIEENVPVDEAVHPWVYRR